MPVITMEASHLTKEQKRELISEMTKLASRVTNIPEQSFVVYLKENNPDNIGVGGVPLAERQKK